MNSIRLDLPRYFRGPVYITDSEWLFNQSKSQAGQDLFVVAMTQGRRHGTWLEIGCGDPVRSNNTFLLETRLGWTGISIDREKMDQDIVTPWEEYYHGFYSAIRKAHWPQQPTHPDLLPDGSSIYDIPYFQTFIQRQITNIDNIPYEQRNWQTARPGTAFYQADATTFDYQAVPKHCDYLQIDIHPSSNNLKLLDLLLPEHRFSVITFEHDAWDHSKESAWARLQSRSILQQHGYEMVISDATVPPGHGNGIGDEPINFEDWWIDPSVISETVWRLYQNLDNSGTAKYYYDTLFLQP